jgi:hypothetical protein
MKEQQGQLTRLSAMVCVTLELVRVLGNKWLKLVNVSGDTWMADYLKLNLVQWTVSEANMMMQLAKQLYQAGYDGTLNERGAAEYVRSALKLWFPSAQYEVVPLTLPSVGGEDVV